MGPSGKCARSAVSFWLGLAIFCFLAVRIEAASDSAIVEAAKKERELSLWSASDLQQVTKMAQQFEKKYPFLKVNVYRSGTATLQSKIITEALAGKHNWDVTNFSSETILGLIDRKLIARYKSSERSMLYEDMMDSEGYWTAIYPQPIILGYNTNHVKRNEVPRNYNELLAPKWKGKKISIDNDGLGLLLALSIAWGREKAVVYLKQLAANEPVPGRGNSLRVQQIAAGEYFLTLAYANPIQAAKFQGAPVDWVVLEPAPVSLNAIMLAEHAPHANAGKLYIDFILSREGQETLRSLQRIPARKDVEPDPPGLIRGYKRVTSQPAKQEEYTQADKLYKQIFDIR
ncbi:MAG TPA: extracellular solute-binding protein [Candidatus Acidoferrales bacterium]|nr:extracellular solute-binding protein [Candidatus Acidoferrales bacterium]